MDLIVNKATFEDVKTQLSNQLNDGYVFDINFDTNIVYVRMWSDSGYKAYQYSFTFSNGVAKISDQSKSAVIAETVYKVVDETVTKSWLKDFISNLLVKKEEVDVVKAIQEEQMISVEVFYPPVGIADLHGDGIVDIDVLKAAIESFNKAVEDGRAKPCLFHTHETKAFEYGKAWVTEKATQYGEDVLPEGTPLIEIHWKNPKAWELRKNGTLLSGSLRGKAGV